MNDVSDPTLAQLLWPSMYVPSTWMSLTNETLPQVAQQLNSTSAASGNIREQSNLMRRRCAAITGHCTHWHLTGYWLLPSLTKRAENSSVSYSTQAILCGDVPDRTLNNTATMRDVFSTIVNTAHNVSHMCMSLCRHPESVCL